MFPGNFMQQRGLKLKEPELVSFNFSYNILQNDFVIDLFHMAFARKLQAFGFQSLF